MSHLAVLNWSVGRESCVVARTSLAINVNEFAGKGGGGLLFKAGFTVTWVIT